MILVKTRMFFRYRNFSLLIHWLTVRVRRGAPRFDLRFAVKRDSERFTDGYCSSLCSNCPHQHPRAGCPFRLGWSPETPPRAVLMVHGTSVLLCAYSP